MMAKPLTFKDIPYAGETPSGTFAIVGAPSKVKPASKQLKLDPMEIKGSFYDVSVDWAAFEKANYTPSTYQAVIDAQTNMLKARDNEIVWLKDKITKLDEEGDINALMVCATAHIATLEAETATQAAEIAELKGKLREAKGTIADITAGKLDLAQEIKQLTAQLYDMKVALLNHGQSQTMAQAVAMLAEQIGITVEAFQKIIHTSYHHDEVGVELRWRANHTLARDILIQGGPPALFELCQQAAKHLAQQVREGFGQKLVDAMLKAAGDPASMVITKVTPTEIIPQTGFTSEDITFTTASGLKVESAAIYMTGENPQFIGIDMAATPPQTAQKIAEEHLKHFAVPKGYMGPPVKYGPHDDDEPF